MTSLAYVLCPRECCARGECFSPWHPFPIGVAQRLLLWQRCDQCNGWNRQPWGTLTSAMQERRDPPWGVSRYVVGERSEDT